MFLRAHHRVSRQYRARLAFPASSVPSYDEWGCAHYAARVRRYALDLALAFRVAKGVVRLCVTTLTRLHWNEPILHGTAACVLRARRRSRSSSCGASSLQATTKWSSLHRRQGLLIPSCVPPSAVRASSSAFASAFLHCWTRVSFARHAAGGEAEEGKIEHFGGRCCRGSV